MYDAILGADWERLPAGVRATHSGGELRGRFDVARGRSLRARLAASLARFPPAANHVETTLTVVRDGDVWLWRRRFGRFEVATAQWLHDGLVYEGYGPLVCILRLVARPEGFDMEPCGAGLRFFGTTMPLPRWLAPSARAEVRGHGSDGARVAVEIRVPLCGVVLAYHGEIRA